MCGLWYSQHFESIVKTSLGWLEKAELCQASPKQETNRRWDMAYHLISTKSLQQGIHTLHYKRTILGPEQLRRPIYSFYLVFPLTRQPLRAISVMTMRYHGFVHIEHLSHKKLPDSDRDLHLLCSPDSHFLGSKHSSQRWALEKRERENHRRDVTLQLVDVAVGCWGQEFIENECRCTWGPAQCGWADPSPGEMELGYENWTLLWGPIQPVPEFLDQRPLETSLPWGWTASQDPGTISATSELPVQLSVFQVLFFQILSSFAKY